MNGYNSIIFDYLDIGVAGCISVFCVLRLYPMLQKLSEQHGKILEGFEIIIRHILSEKK
jgi:hypothetical protein